MILQLTRLLYYSMFRTLRQLGYADEQALLGAGWLLALTFLIGVYAAIYVIAHYEPAEIARMLL